MSRKLRYGIWREGGGGEAKGKVRSKGSVRRDHQIQFMVTTAIVRVIARKAFSHIGVWEERYRRGFSEERPRSCLDVTS